MKERKILKNIRRKRVIKRNIKDIREQITKDFNLTVEDHLNIMIKNIFDTLKDYDSKPLVYNLIDQLESQKNKFKDENDFIIRSCAIFDATAATVASDTIKKFADRFDKQLRIKMEDGSWVKERMEVISTYNNRLMNTLAQS